MRILLFVITCCIIYSCSGNPDKPGKKQEVANNPPVSKEQEIQNKIDTLKNLAEDGDLLTRMNDNMLSYQAKLLNQTDKSFSHAGIIITKNNIKMVCHIIPDKNGSDTVRYEPIDSFINPKYNLLCGLFRYDLSETERIAFINELNRHHDEHIRFDSVYNLKTNNKVYCSEMISKSLTSATHGRMIFKTYTVPKKNAAVTL